MKNDLKSASLAQASHSPQIDRVVVVNDSTIARGGASALAMLSARLLRKRGIPVTYFAGDQGDADGALLADGVDSFGLGDVALMKNSKAGALTRGLFNFKAHEAIREWIRVNDTPRTVYHVHGWQQILSPAVFAALRPVADRTLLHAHDYFLVCPNGGQMNYATDTECTLRPMSARCITTNCDKRNFGHKVWRVGRQAIRNSFSDLGAKNVKVALIQQGMSAAFERAGVPASNLVSIPNPCVPFSDVRVPAESNSEFQFVGRVVAEKGIEEFLAAARVAKAPVRVLGDGPLRESLAIKYPEAVFEGWCGRERLAELVPKARMLVMPSLYPEPFGLVIPEAVSSGVPVIVSESALLAREVVDHRLGFAVDPKDGTGFARLLASCMSEDDLIGEMSHRGFSESNSMSMRPDQWTSELINNYGRLAGMTEMVSQ